MTCEKPLVAAGVESGSGGTNQGLFNLPAPSLCPPALLSYIVFYKLNGANLLSNEGEMTKAWETIAKSVSSLICTMEGGCGKDYHFQN